jgi:antitoxin MazE
MGGDMKTSVQRWGNSLAVRIPKSFAEEVGLSDGGSIELRLVSGGLLIEPSPAPPLSLDDLLGGIDDSNIHGEVDTGFPVGLEAW